VSGNRVELRVKATDGSVVSTLSNYLSGIKADVRSLKVSDPSLEEVFINLTKKDMRDD